jgi:PAS domain S-box-containing protein
MIEILFENTDQYILVTDYSGNLLKWNQNVQSLFELNSENDKGVSLKLICKKLKLDCPLPQDTTDLENGLTLLNQKVSFISQHKTIAFKIVASSDQLFLLGTDITEITTLKKKLTIAQKNINEYESFFSNFSHSSSLIANENMNQGKENLVTYYENIIDLIPGVIFWKDTKGAYLGCNKELLKIRNLTSKDSIIGKNDYDIFTPDEANRLWQNDQLVILTGQTIQIEESIKNSKGEQETYISTKRPLRNADSQIIGLLGMSANITSRKENEDKLVYEKEIFEQVYDTGLKQLARISKEVTGQEVDLNIPIEDHVLNIRSYLENIISCLPGLVFWKDQNGIYLGCNDGMMKWRGAKVKSEIVGKSDYEIFTEKEAILLRENDRKIMQRKEIISVEETVVMANNQTITYLTNKVPLLSASGKAIGILGISLDITDKITAEKSLSVAKDVAERASRSKSEFLANMSHDLRARLHGILGMSDVLEKELYATPHSEHIKTMREAGNNLLEMIEDILSFSELDAQEKSLSKKNFCLPDLLTQSIAMFSYSTSEKNLSLLHKGFEELPQYVLSYPKAIKRIINNLLNNAIKFTETGSVKLTAIISEQKQQDYLILSITDTGIGIPKNQLTAIFEKFTRATPSYEGKYKGVGLGLSIVKEFVQKIGGKVTVKSKINQGTEFTVQLPITITSHAITKEELIGNITDEKIAKIIDAKLKVLLVENDSIGQKFAQLVLEKLNCDITMASNGTEALASLDKKYDIIFSDIGLPDISGFEIASNLPP